MTLIERVPVTHHTFTLVLVAKLDQSLAVAIGYIIAPSCRPSGSSASAIAGILSTRHASACCRRMRPIDELGSFPVGGHDDQVDALSLAFSGVTRRAPLRISAEAVALSRLRPVGRMPAFWHL